MFGVAVAIAATASAPMNGDGGFNRKLLRKRCATAATSPDFARDSDFCLQHVYAIANQIDAYRMAHQMPQCIPTNAKPERLRLVAVRALRFDHESGNWAEAVGNALLAEFSCTSDPLPEKQPSRR